MGPTSRPFPSAELVCIEANMSVRAIRAAAAVAIMLSSPGLDFATTPAIAQAQGDAQEERPQRRGNRDGTPPTTPPAGRGGSDATASGSTGGDSATSDGAARNADGGTSDVQTSDVETADVEAAANPGEEAAQVGDDAPDDELAADAPTDGASAEETAGFSDDGYTADAPQGPSIAPGVLSVARERGAFVYRRYCASCHGPRGDGQGPAARFLRVAPRSFVAGVYKWRTTMSGELPTDADLIRTIRRGAPGTTMPAWEGRLSLADIFAVTQYIKSFSPRFTEEQPQRLAMPADAPAFDRRTVARGRLMYVLMQCWTCHGMDGTGNGPAADTLVDDEGLPSIAYDFTQGRMRSGTRPIDVYRTYATGVNGTPMPSYDEAIAVGRDAYEDLTTFEAAITGSEMGQLRQFLASLPTTAELWALPEADRQTWAAARRWELVAYVLSLSGSGAVLDYLGQDPYSTR